MGLVQYVTEPGKQFEKAMELARKVASAAPLGVRSILQNSRLAEKKGEEAAKKIIYQTVSEVMKSDDMKEGLQSFIERRTAVFKGK
jgi:enoyl-CoA hydratase/carnithine racemase